MGHEEFLICEIRSSVLSVKRREQHTEISKCRMSFFFFFFFLWDGTGKKKKLNNISSLLNVDCVFFFFFFFWREGTDKKKSLMARP